MPLGNLKAGQRLDTALTWLHHVTRAGSGSAGSMTYTEAAALADFSLTLLRDGKRIVISDDKANNVEYLSLLLDQPGNYSLEVYRYAGSGIASEPFALAERVLTIASTRHGRAIPAAVRRGVGNALSEQVVPQSAGAAASAAVTAIPVPEPGGALIVLFTVMLAQRRRGRRLSICV